IHALAVVALALVSPASPAAASHRSAGAGRATAGRATAEVARRGRPPASRPTPRLRRFPKSRPPATLPPFRGEGYLPAGEHVVTFAGLERRFGGTARRQALLGQLRSLVEVVERVGGGEAEVLIGGSFVSAKAAPGDLDLMVRVRDPRAREPVWEA